MKNTNVVIVDYGIGNLLSVRRALEYCGAAVEISSNRDVIRNANKLVLPGVGAFPNAMYELKERFLDDAIFHSVARGVPLLGICLGMQLLFDESDEFCLTRGLGLIPGRIQAISKPESNNRSLKIPYVGWSSLEVSDSRENWDDTLLQNIKPEDAVYFVHSFMAVPKDPSNRVADYLFGELPVCATVQSKNIYGCQFHPEKSGMVGLQILKQFILL